jgi:hypothetical protein
MLASVAAAVPAATHWDIKGVASQERSAVIDRRYNKKRTDPGLQITDHFSHRLGFLISFSLFGIGR